MYKQLFSLSQVYFALILRHKEEPELKKYAKITASRALRFPQNNRDPLALLRTDMHSKNSSQLFNRDTGRRQHTFQPMDQTISANGPT